jgi:hypothetical protein
LQSLFLGEAAEVTVHAVAHVGRVIGGRRGQA